MLRVPPVITTWEKGGARVIDRKDDRGKPIPITCPMLNSDASAVMRVIMMRGIHGRASIGAGMTRRTKLAPKEVTTS